MGPGLANKESSELFTWLLKSRELKDRKWFLSFGLALKSIFAHIKDGNPILWLRHYRKNKIKGITGHSQESQAFQVTSNLFSLTDITIFYLTMASSPKSVFTEGNQRYKFSFIIRQNVSPPKQTNKKPQAKNWWCILAVWSKGGKTGFFKKMKLENFL